MRSAAPELWPKLGAARAIGDEVAPLHAAKRGLQPLLVPAYFLDGLEGEPDVLRGGSLGLFCLSGDDRLRDGKMPSFSTITFCRRSKYRSGPPGL
jgi:hypothetical protein